MKPCILTTTIASLLFASVAFATTHTWDGGGVSNNITEGANWTDNIAPGSSLATTELIFSGGTRLSPNFTNSFSALSITFDNVVSGSTLGFSLGTSSVGPVLSVGAGGIVNNDSHTAGFGSGLPVSLIGLFAQTINAASGDLLFESPVSSPSPTVTGAHNTTFANGLSVSGTLTKTGSGELVWLQNAAIGFDVTVGAGTLTLSNDGSVDVFNSGTAIAVNGTGIFNMNAGLTLNGAPLTRATGAGSSFTGNSTLSFGGGAGGVLNVLAGGTVAATGVNLGTVGDETATVSGSGSSLSAGSLFVGASGNAGALTFASASTGMFAGINVDVSSIAGTSGTVSIQGGATVTGTGLSIATGTAANTGTVSITNAGSALTLSGAATATIGAASATSGALNVNAGGTFDSGTGLTTVNATGAINIPGGTYHSNGDLTLIAGTLTRSATGVLDLGAGTTFTIQGAGTATITGAFSNNTASTIHLTGGGSALTTTGTLSINGGSTLVAAVGSDVSTGGNTVNVGTSGNGTVSITNTGSSLSAGVLNVGASGNTGSVTFSNGSTGTLGAINVDNSVIAGTSGLLQIQSGAAVTGTGLTVAPTTAANAGTLTINGASSALTLSGAATAGINATSGSMGAFNVQSSGTFNGGTGLTTIHKTGTVAIAGGTFNANGAVTLNGGQLTRDAAGVFTLAAGKTLTVQNGGDTIFTGTYGAPSNSIIAVTGAGSTLSTTSTLTLGSGSTTNVSAGGSIGTGAGTALVATFGGNATVTVDGSGSSFSGGGLTIAQNAHAGTVTFSNAGRGAFNAIQVGVSGLAGSVGNLFVQSGATVTGTSLSVASTASASTGTLTITGAGSALTITGAGVTTIGAAGSSTATVNVQNGGTFTTGTGQTNVNATGDLNINTGGALIVRGDMFVQSSLDIGNGGTVILDATAPPAPGGEKLEVSPLRSARWPASAPVGMTAF